MKPATSPAGAWAVTKGKSIDDAAKRRIETTRRPRLCWRWHCEQVGVDRDKLLKYVGAVDYNIHLLEPGVTSSGTAGR